METNILKNEDCTWGMVRIPNESIDCLVTDYPYQISHNGKPSGGGIFNQEKNENVRSGKLFEYNDTPLFDWLPKVYYKLKPGTHAYIMVNARNLYKLMYEAKLAGFTIQNLLIWDKGNATQNKYYMQAAEFILMLSKRPARNINYMGTKTILRVPSIRGGRLHPCEKPIELMEILIRNSTNPGDVVLDPFAGAGSTLVAAYSLKRKYIGYEIDPKYYSIAQQRLQALQNPTI